MDKLEAMNALVKVVASGSYAEAARRLGADAIGRQQGRYGA